MMIFNPAVANIGSLEVDPLLLSGLKNLFCEDIRGSQRMFPAEHGELSTFPVAPSAGWSHYLFQDEL